MNIDPEEFNVALRNHALGRSFRFSTILDRGRRFV